MRSWPPRDRPARGACARGRRAKATTPGLRPWIRAFSRCSSARRSSPLVAPPSSAPDSWTMHQPRVVHPSVGLYRGERVIIDEALGLVDPLQRDVRSAGESALVGQGAGVARPESVGRTCCGLSKSLLGVLVSPVPQVFPPETPGPVQARAAKKQQGPHDHDERNPDQRTDDKDQFAREKGVHLALSLAQLVRRPAQANASARATSTPRCSEERPACRASCWDRCPRVSRVAPRVRRVREARRKRKDSQDPDEGATALGRLRTVWPTPHWRPHRRPSRRRHRCPRRHPRGPRWSTGRPPDTCRRRSIVRGCTKAAGARGIAEGQRLVDIRLVLGVGAIADGCVRALARARVANVSFGHRDTV